MTTLLARVPARTEIHPRLPCRVVVLSTRATLGFPIQQDSRKVVVSTLRIFKSMASKLPRPGVVKTHFPRLTGNENFILAT
jgi:hypothetical protein